METGAIWTKYPSTYRQQEMQILAQWVAAVQSGSVVGLPGCGRSNLLDFLCYRPEVLATYIPTLHQQVVLIPINLHTLPTTDIATFYRFILRAFYHTRHRFSSALQEETTRLYQENAQQLDPFITQSAIEELLLLFQSQSTCVVWVLNYFDRFFEEAFFSEETTPKTIDTLRGLRDTFKHTLCLIAGMSQEITCLPNSELLGGLYELLDRNICWVGAMVDQDAHNLIARAMTIATVLPNEKEVQTMLRLSGNFPVLLKLICTWWSEDLSKLSADQWLPFLMAQSNIRRRLTKMWSRLTQEERILLSEIEGAHVENGESLQNQHHLLERLVKKGVCVKTERGWKVRGDIFATYVKEAGIDPGKIWMDETTQIIYRGMTPVEELTPFEWRLLDYLIRNPYHSHTKDELIAYIWEDKDGSMVDNDLQQLVYRVRKKVDTDPPRYIITRKGRLGGYQFYPEGTE